MARRTRQTTVEGPAAGTNATADLVGSAAPANLDAWLIYKASAEVELTRLRDAVTALSVVRDSQAAAQKLGVAHLLTVTQAKRALETRNEHLTLVNADLRADVKRRKRQAARAVNALME
jgi:hypothetical protein